RLQPRMYDVTAVKPCEFLVVEQEILNQLLRAAPVAQVEMDSADGVAGASEAHHLLMEFYSELRSNQVQLPSVPDVAWKGRRVVDREDSSAAEVADAASADPAMAATLVRPCNSPLGRGFSDVRNVTPSLVRLAMRPAPDL